jgi:hypothetical protein
MTTLPFPQTEFRKLSIPGMGVVYYAEVLENTPRYSFADGQSRVQRTYLINWTDRDRFVFGILGFPRIAFVQGKSRNDAPYDTYVSRTTPHAIVDYVDPIRRAPYWLDIFGNVQSEDEAANRPLTNFQGTWLFAKSVESVVGLEPMGTVHPLTRVPEYVYALVTVNYEPTTYRVFTDTEAVLHHLLEYELYPVIYEALLPLWTQPQLDPEDDWLRFVPPVNPNDPLHVHVIPYDFYMTRYVTRTVRPVIEYLALPRGLMRWVEPLAPGQKPTVVDYASAVAMPSMEIIYTWHQVPFIPEAVYTHVGKVNEQDFYDGHQVFRAGTLLLLGSEIRPYRTAAGKFVVDVQYRVKYIEPFPDSTRPARGHNYFLRYKGGVDKLFFQKITSNGRGDRLDGVTADPGKPIFDYAPFQELFSWHVSNHTRATLYRPE